MQWQYLTRTKKLKQITVGKRKLLQAVKYIYYNYYNREILQEQSLPRSTISVILQRTLISRMICFESEVMAMKVNFWLQRKKLVEAPNISSSFIWKQLPSTGAKYWNRPLLHKAFLSHRCNNRGILADSRDSFSSSIHWW